MSTWAEARHKNAAAAGSWTHADLNSVQDQYVRATGIRATDMDRVSVTEKLGLNEATDKKRGKSYIPQSEYVGTGAAYTLAPTPDQVTDIVLETDGLLIITFRATLAACDIPGCGTGTAGAAFHIDGVPLKMATAGEFGAGLEIGDVGSAAATGPFGTCGEAILTSSVRGMESGAGAAGPIRVVSTGEIMTVGDGSYELLDIKTNRREGGPIYVFAAAGTYTIDVRYFSGGFCLSDIYTVDRLLTVEAIDF